MSQSAGSFLRPAGGRKSSDTMLNSLQMLIISRSILTPKVDFCAKLVITLGIRPLKKEDQRTENKATILLVLEHFSKGPPPCFEVFGNFKYFLSNKNINIF